MRFEATFLKGHRSGGGVNKSYLDGESGGDRAVHPTPSTRPS